MTQPPDDGGVAVTDPGTQPSDSAPIASRRPSRYRPAILDAILPGLGHLVAGRRRLASVFGLPVVVLLALGAVIAVLNSPARLLAQLVNPSILAAILALQVGILAWRALAVGASLLDRRLARLTIRDALPIAALAVVVVLPQAYAGYVTEVARETALQIFVSGTSGGAWQPSAGPSLAPDPSTFGTSGPGASASALPSLPTGNGRLNVLLIGTDAGPGRSSLNTDTMIVASLDPVGQTVSMVSVPRDMVDVPLPDGRTYRAKINSLLSYARLNPGEFPGSDGTGHDVLMGALGTLLGIRIDYYAQVNLPGFVHVVERLGGIDVNVAHGFCDPSYRQYGYLHGFSITAGRHHLDAYAALAYARVRKPAGESDFTRAARQQEVLTGIRDAIVHGGFLNDPVGLLHALAETIETNVPPSLLPDLADMMTRIDRSRTYRAVIDHPLVASGFDDRGSIQLPDIPAIRALVAQLFSGQGATPAEQYAAPPPASGPVTSGGTGNCYAPPPPPSPTPGASGTPGGSGGSSGPPSASASASPGESPSASPGSSAPSASGTPSPVSPAPTTTTPSSSAPSAASSPSP